MRGLATAAVAVPASPAPASRPATVHSIDAARRRFNRPTADDTVRVLVVARHAMIRAGLRLLVEGERGMSVVGEAPTGRHAAGLLHAVAPQVVLFAAGRLEPEVLASTRPLAGRVAILLLTESDTGSRGLAAVRAGATGFLSDDSSAAELASALRTLAAGGALLPPHTTRTLISELVDTPARDAR